MVKEARPSSAPARAGRLVRRFAFAVTLAAALAAFLLAGGPERLDFEAISARHSDLRAWAKANAVIAALGFITGYALLAAISLPGVLWFTIAGGLVFGWLEGAVYSWLGATIGATIFFVAVKRAARTDVIGFLQRLWGARWDAWRAGLQNHEFTYLVLSRLLPLPFFAVNVAAAALHARLWVFVAATGLGLIPASLVYAALGAAAGDTLEAGEGLTPQAVLRPELALAFIGLALLAASPLLLKRIMGRAGTDPPAP